MRVAIVGSRSINDMRVLEDAIVASQFQITEVISGGANGVDTLASIWAVQHNVPMRIYRPDWKIYGRSAGYRRNVTIIEAAEAVIAVWDGVSRGTAHSMGLARTMKKPLFVKRIQ